MVEANKKAHAPVLSTWQWIGVIALIVGGIIGIDQRMQSTVRAFADVNNTDHARIRDQLEVLAESIPPTWLTDKVSRNEVAIDQVVADLAAIRIGIAELKIGIQNLQINTDKQ